MMNMNQVIHGHENGSAREGKLERHTPNELTVRQLLSIAFERAFQRRLGDVPSPTDVHKAVDKLTHADARPSAFVQHAVRVEEQLARLHTHLQKAQEPQDHAISSIQGTPTMPLTRTQKRSATYNDDPTHPIQEMKRTRLDGTDPSRPRPHTPPSTSNNLELNAPVRSMTLRSRVIGTRSDSGHVDPPWPRPHTPPSTSNNPERNVPVRSMTLRSRVIDRRLDSKHVDPPRADSVRSRQASVPDSPSGLPVMAVEPPTSGPSNNITSEPNRKTRQRSPSNDNAEGGSHGHAKPQVTHSAGIPDPGGKVPSASIFPDDAQGSPLPTVASPTTMGVPAYTRQQVGSSSVTTSFVANVPGIWAIQVGKPSAGETDVAFVVDQDTASSVHRWSRHRQGFDPDARHVVVHLVALQTTAVSAVQHILSQGPGGITPQAFALALRDLQPHWPEDGSLVLQLNAGQPRERTWLPSDMSSGMPLDVSSAICEGTNSLHIMQLKNMADIVFAMYAAPPTPESLATALEWERFRKLYSFQRPRSGWSLG